MGWYEVPSAAHIHGANRIVAYLRTGWHTVSEKMGAGSHCGWPQSDKRSLVADSDTPSLGDGTGLRKLMNEGSRVSDRTRGAFSRCLRDDGKGTDLLSGFRVGCSFFLLIRFPFSIQGCSSRATTG